MRDFRKYRLIVFSGRQSQYEPKKCELCGQQFKIADKYHDGGWGNRAHVKCVEVQKFSSKGATA